MPDYSQNFNRYSYALNNPLLFTDPSGEIPILAVLAYVAMQGIISGDMAKDSEMGFWGGFAIGATTAGINMGVSAALGPIMTGPGILPGSVNAIVPAAVSGTMTYGINSLATGQSFDWKGWGLNLGMAGVMGGIEGGITANNMGLDILDGTGTTTLESNVVITDEMLTRGSPTGVKDGKSLNDYKINHFNDSDRIPVSYGDESAVVRNNGYKVDLSGSLVKDGRPVSGVTFASKEGMFSKLEVLMAISPKAAVYSNNLNAVLGHELIHAFHFQNGFVCRYGTATSEYYAYKYSASCFSSDKLNYAFSMKYVYGPNAVKIPFGYKTVYPSWVPKNLFY